VSLRSRKYVVLLVTAVVAGVYTSLARGWSDFEFYAGGAALIIIIGAVGLPWMEFAPDGAFRRRSST
jgi:hypothetical protein